MIKKNNTFWTLYLFMILMLFVLFSVPVYASDYFISMVNQPSDTFSGNIIESNPSVQVLNNFSEPFADVNILVEGIGKFGLSAGLFEIETDSDGIAEFDDLIVNIAQGNYRLKFTVVGEDESVFSDAFDILPDPAIISNVNLVGDYIIRDCASGSMLISNSYIDDSEIICSNLTNVQAYSSVIANLNRDLENATLEFATVSGNTLQSGLMTYSGLNYFGPFNLDNIYAGIPPSPEGVSGTNIPAVRPGNSFYVTYSSGATGYNVYMDANDFGESANFPLLDNGEGNDKFSNDGIYTSANLTVPEDIDSGEYNIIIYVDDGFDNEWTVSTSIYIDNSPPTGSIEVYELDRAEPSDTVRSRIVRLKLSADDDFEVDSCRLANENQNISERVFEPCLESQIWILTPLNGIKNITYQIKDVAGNIQEYIISVLLQTTDVGRPSVRVPSQYWGHSDYVTFEIYHEESVDPGTTYDYRIYEDGNNITSRRHTEIRNVMVTGLNLDAGRDYEIGVRALSGGISEEAFSEVFRITTDSPEIIVAQSSFLNNMWVSDPFLYVNLLADSGVIPIKGFSYTLSKENREPNNNVNLHGNNRTLYITGLEPGEYYLNIKALNEAMLASSTETFVIRYDNRRPPIPIATDLVPGVGNLVFNWTEVNHFPSGIDGYELDIATDRNFNNIVHSENVTGNSFSYTTTQGATYHFRIRSISGAGVYSLYSNQRDEFIDTTPPNISNIKPAGKVFRLSPTLSVLTDKDSDCFFRNTQDGQDRKFEFTGGRFHDNRLHLEENSYEYLITCYNKFNEASSVITEFQIDVDALPNGIFLEGDYENGFSAFSGMDLDFVISMKSGNSPISGIDLNKFSFFIDSESYNDFSIDDFGKGNYGVTFTVPSKKEEFEVDVCYDGKLCLGSISVDVFDVMIEIILGGVDAQRTSSGERMIYARSDNNIFGFASDSEDVALDIFDNNLRLKNRQGNGNNYIFFTPHYVSDQTLSSKDDLLIRNEFYEYFNPIFSGEPNEYLAVMMGLNYENIVFSSNKLTSARRLMLQNNGLTRNQKINISIISD